VGVSVQLPHLPDEAAELPRQGDPHHVAGLAPLLAQMAPARVQAALGPPADLARPRVGASLAALEVARDAGLVAVVAGRLDQ
jgi:hypothetical protein